MLPNINVFTYFNHLSDYDEDLTEDDEDELSYLGLDLEAWNEAKAESEYYEDIGSPFQNFDESQEYVIRDKRDGKYYQASRYFLSWDQSSPWAEADVEEVISKKIEITVYKKV